MGCIVTVVVIKVMVIIRISVYDLWLSIAFEARAGVGHHYCVSVCYSRHLSWQTQTDF